MGNCLRAGSYTTYGMIEMKLLSVKLVYFSPTGTTKAAVSRIAHALPCSSVDERDITRPDVREQSLLTSENELLIIGVPVYMGRVPALAAQWLQKLKAQNTPAVCVVVYGNRAVQDALLELSAHGNGPDRKGTWHYPADHERAGKIFFRIFPIQLLTSVTFHIPGSRSPDPCGLWHHTKAFNLTRTRHHEVRENSPGPDNADGQGYAGSMQQKIPRKKPSGKCECRKLNS